MHHGFTKFGRTNQRRSYPEIDKPQVIATIVRDEDGREAIVEDARSRLTGY
jgi:hypothetical protein